MNIMSTIFIQSDKWNSSLMIVIKTPVYSHAFNFSKHMYGIWLRIYFIDESFWLAVLKL